MPTVLGAEGTFVVVFRAVRIMTKVDIKGLLLFSMCTCIVLAMFGVMIISHIYGILQCTCESCGLIIARLCGVIRNVLQCVCGMC